MPRITDIFLKYLKDKNMKSVLILALAGIFLISLSFFPKESSKKEKTDFSIEEYRIKKEKELENFILKIDGVKKCEVMISFKDKGTTSFSYNKSTSEEKDENEMVVVRSSGDEIPVTEKVTLPEISGITVISDAVKGMETTLSRAVAAAAGTGIHNVEVIINERN